MLPAAGIYIHIPYCKQACTYCDFYFSTVQSTIPQTVEGIVKEAVLRKNELTGHTIQSIYLGGGTPSLLTKQQLSQIFDALHNQYDTRIVKEITIETNPDDITPQRLQEWKQLGINRLSIGIQSFADDELKQMNRAHTAQQALQCVQWAKEAGFSNITVDLIYGTPWKSASQWEKDVKTVLAMDVPHVSAYQLTLEPKTQLTHWVNTGKVTSLPEENTYEQFWSMKKWLAERGIVQYEVSNFAKPGYEAVHNRSYWQGLPYLGLGPSAHSFAGTKRKWNHANLHTWFKALQQNQNWWEEENLTEEQQYNELILTRLRTRTGLDFTLLQSFPPRLQAHFKHETEKQKQLGYLEEFEGHIRITESHVLLTDNICCELFFVAE